MQKLYLATHSNLLFLRDSLEEHHYHTDPLVDVHHCISDRPAFVFKTQILYNSEKAPHSHIRRRITFCLPTFNSELKCTKMVKARKTEKCLYLFDRMLVYCRYRSTCNVSHEMCASKASLVPMVMLLGLVAAGERHELLSHFTGNKTSSYSQCVRKK